MIINGYDTTVGNKLKRDYNVEGTLKALSTTNRLELVNPQGVYGISYDNADSIPSFVLPLTLKNFKNQTITVFDQRHYMNKSNNVVNIPEYTMMMVASVIQQQVANGKRSLISSSEFVTTKAFSKAISALLGPQSNLNLNQKIELEIILAHYYVCLSSNPDEDFKFVSQNTIATALKYSAYLSAPIIDEIGYINTLEQLTEVLRTRETLPTLSRLDIGGLIGIINRIWFVSSGFKIITSAAAELPHLFTAICYATVTNTMYKKTEIGKVLELKNTPEVGAFIKVINAGIY